MWVELKVPVPPGVAKLCGYPGEARYVGLRWGRHGDECEYDDGRSSGTGFWRAYQTYTQHLAVGPALAVFDLGGGDKEAKDILILDQVEQKAVVADLRTGRDFLRRQQHPPLPELDGADAAESLTDFLDVSQWRGVTLDQVEMEERRRAEVELVEKMVRFLDDFLEDAKDDHDTGGEG